MDQDKLEEVVIQIIINSGEARSHCLNAIKLARQGNYTESDVLIQTAKECLSKAHIAQTELIRNEEQGNASPPTMVMIHAQDHLMNALTIRDLATEMIEIQKMIKN